MASMVKGVLNLRVPNAKCEHAPLEIYKGKYITKCVKSSRDRQV